MANPPGRHICEGRMRADLPESAIPRHFEEAAVLGAFVKKNRRAASGAAHEGARGRKDAVSHGMLRRDSWAKSSTWCRTISPVTM